MKLLIRPTNAEPRPFERYTSASSRHGAGQLAKLPDKQSGSAPPGFLLICKSLAMLVDVKSLPLGPWVTWQGTPKGLHQTLCPLCYGEPSLSPCLQCANDFQNMVSGELQDPSQPYPSWIQQLYRTQSRFRVLPWVVRFGNRPLCSAALKVCKLLGNAESNGLIQFGCLLIMLSGVIIVEILKTTHHCFNCSNPLSSRLGVEACDF